MGTPWRAKAKGIEYLVRRSRRAPHRQRPTVNKIRPEGGKGRSYGESKERIRERPDFELDQTSVGMWVTSCFNVNPGTRTQGRARHKLYGAPARNRTAPSTSKGTV